MQYRRSDYDVTNTVQVSSVASVRKAVEELFSQTWPGASIERLTTAFADFERLFSGQFPGYFGCDTVYHDLQHSLDDTLAMARLLAGYDRTHAPDQRLGADRALIGIVVALFHDAGYIRQIDDTQHRNGAEFTRTHVMRRRELPRALPADHRPGRTGCRSRRRSIHFTGYEVPFDQIRLDDPRDRKRRPPARHGGHDRADVRPLLPREMPRPPVSGIRARRRRDVSARTTAGSRSQYGSGLDVLRQTPRVLAETRCARGSTASSAAPTATSRACSAAAIRTWKRSTRNLAYLKQRAADRRWSMLRREPPCFTWEKNPLQNMRTLVIDHLKTTVAAA